MKTIQSIFLMGALLVSTQAAAQECYLSTDCEGTQICVNRSCSTSIETLRVCNTSEDCDYRDSCMSNVCKPEGVACATATGTGSISVDRGTAICANGMGSEWSADMECVPGADDCEIPTLDELSDDELETKYLQCVEDLNSSCGTEIPIPEDVCSPEALQLCTDFVLLNHENEVACADFWKEYIFPDDLNGGTGSETSTTVDPGDGGDVDVDTGSSDAVSNDIAIQGIIPARGLVGEANPWEVVSCCADFEAHNEEAEMTALLVNCTKGIAPSECNAVATCLEDIWEQYDLNGDDVAGEDELNATDSDDNDPSDTSDDRNVYDDDLDGASDGVGGEGAVDAEETSTGSDSGCSIANPGGINGSLLSLIL